MSEQYLREIAPIERAYLPQRYPNREEGVSLWRCYLQAKNTEDLKNSKHKTSELFSKIANAREREPDLKNS